MYPVIYKEMAAHGRMTIKLLAHEVGVTPKTMGKKLQGETPFNLNEMRTIQKIFNGLPLDELFSTQPTRSDTA